MAFPSKQARLLIVFHIEALVKFFAVEEVFVPEFDDPTEDFEHDALLNIKLDGLQIKSKVVNSGAHARLLDFCLDRQELPLGVQHLYDGGALARLY